MNLFSICKGSNLTFQKSVMSHPMFLLVEWCWFELAKAKRWWLCTHVKVRWASSWILPCHKMIHLNSDVLQRVSASRYCFELCTLVTLRSYIQVFSINVQWSAFSVLATCCWLLKQQKMMILCQSNALLLVPVSLPGPKGAFLILFFS